MIRVVKVKPFPTPEQRAAVAYVGRAAFGWPEHELANPFKAPHPYGDGQSLSVIDLYRDWLGLTEAYPQIYEPMMAALWEECDHGRKPLGCWCGEFAHGDGKEVVCHAQVLAEELAKRYGGEFPQVRSEAQV